MKKSLFYIVFLIVVHSNAQRSTINFNSNWKFLLGNDSTAVQASYNDLKWRTLTLPHDWSIELPFDEKAPATNQGGSLPGGIGWYRKTFTLPLSSKNKKIFIEFDGIYKNSEVWINGHYLGKRPYGYVAFQYELTEYLKFGKEQNIIAIKVDNSQQPNSRWYSGSGIYRDVQLVTKNKTHIDYNGTFVTTSNISNQQATVHIASKLNNIENNLKVVSIVYNQQGKKVAEQSSFSNEKNFTQSNTQSLKINNPILWSVDNPYLYKAVTTIYQNNIAIDQSTTTFGIRSIKFDAAKGFFLNGKHVLLKGVCMHHDLGAIGAAFNRSAAERQLKILKEMGCNAIRVSHNPPAAAFLDLCDSMGFLVMDEAFDMWKKKKNKYDYNMDFNEWYKRDVESMVKRDRNHPSVIIWSIGNEIREQFDSSGIALTKEMVAIVKALDSTRPVTSALTENVPSKNFITKGNALDVLGFNYKELDYDSLPFRFPNMPIIATETASALETRGEYLLPADSMRIWPPDSKAKKTGNNQLTCNAYDNTYAYWGNTHEKSWLAVKQQPWMAGLFVWSGFDFIGEPVPYPYPARSSYYGIVDLAGFPKDVYYMYQSEWTNKPVLHILPHWNWKVGDTVDVWAYYNMADEVELFLNDKSLGKKSKDSNNVHVTWKVPFESGILKAVSKKNGKIVLVKQVQTADKPTKIILSANKRIIHPTQNELCFITATIVDANGIVVPNANQLIDFKTTNNALVEATDNGSPIDLTPFRAKQRNAFNGLCLAIIKAKSATGTIRIEAVSKGLQKGLIQLQIQ